MRLGISKQGATITLVAAFGTININTKGWAKCALARLAGVAMILAALPLLLAPGVQAQSLVLITTVPVGDTPGGIAANPTTSLVYVVNSESGGSVSVIDGIAGSATDNQVIATVNVDSKPRYAAVNSTTNRVYVTHFESRSVSIIDASNMNHRSKT